MPFCIQQAESTVYIRKAGSTLRETCTDYGFIINLAIAAVAILIGNLLCHKQYGQQLRKRRRDYVSEISTTTTEVSEIAKEQTKNYQKEPTHPRTEH